MSAASHPIRTELKGLAKLALPIAVAQAGQSLMGFTDTAIAGRAGAETLGGVGLGNALFFAVGSFGMGAMMGLDPLISQAVGAGNQGRARRLLWQGLWLSLALFALALPVILLMPGLLTLMGTEAGLLSEARAYILWRAPSFLPLCLYGALRSYLQGRGRTAPIVWAAIIANVFNVFADMYLIFGGASLPEWTGPLRLMPAMGAAGAAIATVLGALLQVAIMVWGVRLLPVVSEVGRWKPDLRQLREALSVGLPVGLHFMAEVGVFAMSGVLASRLGTLAVAAHQIVLTYGSLSFTFAMGIGTAGSTRVGWAVGARDNAAASRSAWVAFAAGTAFMSLTAMVFLLFPAQLMRLMTNDPEVFKVGVSLMLVAAVFQIADGVQGVGAGVLRGVGDTRFTFLANLVGHWLFGMPIAVGLGFGLGLGVQGIWWGLCTGLILVAIALLARFHYLSKRPFRRLAGAGDPQAPLPG